jgi:hypothetical protein
MKLNFLEWNIGVTELFSNLVPVQNSSQSGNDIVCRRGGWQAFTLISDGRRSHAVDQIGEGSTGVYVLHEEAQLKLHS